MTVGERLPYYTFRSTFDVFESPETEAVVLFESYVVVHNKNISEAQ